MVTVVTRQKESFDAAYGFSQNPYGMPDRKITDGQELRGKRILNLGGGESNDLWFLTDRNLVVNMDYAWSGLVAGTKHGVRGVQGDMNATSCLPFPDRSFDLIVCKDILEHLMEPIQVLSEAKRVLRDDGCIVISIPNHFYWPFRARMLFGKGIMWQGLFSKHGDLYQEWNYMHIRFFTYLGFRQFLSCVGLVPQRFYWDFGSLAHYYNPDMWLEPQLWKRHHGISLSRRSKMGVFVIRPLWTVLNIIFPRSLRRLIVSLSPGLLCSGFYVRCMKEKQQIGTI
jgi:SAM-dependent methyltransferase